jgi:hypothetical protein
MDAGCSVTPCSLVEAIGGWRKLWGGGEKLPSLYSSPDFKRIMKWRRMRWVGLVARIAYQILAVKAEIKKPLGRSWCR